MTEIANLSIEQFKKYESLHQIRFVFSASESTGKEVFLKFMHVPVRDFELMWSRYN